MPEWMQSAAEILALLAIVVVLIVTTSKAYGGKSKWIAHGAKSAWRCDSCGEVSDKRWRYCPHCGKRME